MNRKEPLAAPRTVVLVGLMGAGKTSIGRRLAARLGLTFTDADTEIEAAAGCSIADIFELHGEQAFRDGERRVIARLLDGPPHVLATGGGAFLDPKTRERVREKAISVWLRASLDTLVKRVERSRTRRPILEEGDPRKILADLIEERYPVYETTDIIIDTGEGPHEPVVESIVEKLRAFRKALAAAQATEEDPSGE